MAKTEEKPKRKLPGDLLDVTMEHPHPPPTWRGVAPLEAHRGEPRLWIAQPQLPFRPAALLLYGVDATTFVTNILVGRNLQGYVALGRIPGEFFATARSYEKLLEQFAENGIATPSWITFEPCMPGQQLVVHIEGKCTGVLMLGHSIR